MSKAMKFQVLVDKTNNAAPNLKPTAVNAKKGAVLGALQNREPTSTLVRGLSARESALKSLKLQDVKPRVVTRFPKPIAAASAANVKKSKAGQPLQTNNNGQGKAKPIDRENVVVAIPKARLLEKATNGVVVKPQSKVLTNKQATTISLATTASTAAAIAKPTTKITALKVKPKTAAGSKKCILTTKQQQETEKSETTESTEVFSTANEVNAKKPVAVNKKFILTTKQQQQQLKQEQKEETTETVLVVKSESTKFTKVLANIENIDENDEKKDILVSHYINDIYEYLFQLERQQLIRHNHLDTQTEISPRMRAVLINWINEVHAQFHLAIETYHMTVAIVDRYLQLVNNTKRSDFQLVGVTALFIAAKYEELFPPSVADLSYITDDSCNNKEILLMELKMLNVLDCNLSRPLPIHFLRRFSKAAKAESCHHTASKYFLELVSIEYDMAHYRPSKIAAGSLLLALHLFNENANTTRLGFNAEIWTPTLTHYSSYAGNELRNVVKKIANLVLNAPNAKLDAVYRKYESPKYLNISKCEEMSGDLIKSIIHDY